MSESQIKSSYVGDCYVLDTSKYGSLLFLVDSVDCSVRFQADYDAENPTSLTFVLIDNKRVGVLPEQISAWTAALINQGYGQALSAEIVSFNPRALPGEQLLLRLQIVKSDAVDNQDFSYASAVVYDEDIPF